MTSCTYLPLQPGTLFGPSVLSFGVIMGGEQNKSNRYAFVPASVVLLAIVALLLTGGLSRSGSSEASAPATELHSQPSEQAVDQENLSPSNGENPSPSNSTGDQGRPDSNLVE